MNGPRGEGKPWYNISNKLFEEGKRLKGEGPRTREGHIGGGGRVETKEAEFC